MLQPWKLLWLQACNYKSSRNFKMWRIEIRYLYLALLTFVPQPFPLLVPALFAHSLSTIKFSHIMATIKPPDYTHVNHNTANDSDDEHANPISQTRRASWWMRLHRFWVDSWAAEMTSCAIALSSLVCLIAILSAYQDRVLGDLPMKLSINTLVSILASILKASLIMPVAECKSLHMYNIPK